MPGNPADSQCTGKWTEGAGKELLKRKARAKVTSPKGLAKNSRISMTT